MPSFSWNIPLVSLIFLKRSLVFPILFFSSISLHCSLKKAFLSLHAIIWNSAFRCLYLSFSPLFSTSLFFTAICKASPDSHFAFLHFFSMGIVFFLIFFYFLNFKIFNSYMRSQTWTPLPPPSPQHLSGSSPCTSPKHAAPYVRHGLAIQFLHDSIHVRMAWGWPTEMLWGGRWEGGSCLGTHVRIKDFKI